MKGKHIPRVVFPADYDTYLDVYNEHLTLLKSIKEKNVRAYHAMTHRLYNLARYVAYRSREHRLMSVLPVAMLRSLAQPMRA